MQKKIKNTPIVNPHNFFKWRVAGAAQSFRVEPEHFFLSSSGSYTYFYSTVKPVIFMGTKGNVNFGLFDFLMT